MYFYISSRIATHRLHRANFLSWSNDLRTICKRSANDPEGGPSSLNDDRYVDTENPSVHLPLYKQKIAVPYCTSPHLYVQQQQQPPTDSRMSLSRKCRIYLWFDDAVAVRRCPFVGYILLFITANARRDLNLLIESLVLWRTLLQDILKKFIFSKNKILEISFLK